jgi:hypothetical protein
MLIARSICASAARAGAQLDRLAVEALGGPRDRARAGDRAAVIEQAGLEDRLAAERPDRGLGVADPRARVGGSGAAARRAATRAAPRARRAGDRGGRRSPRARRPSRLVGRRLVVAARLLDEGTQVQRLGEHDRARARARRPQRRDRAARPPARGRRGPSVEGEDLVAHRLEAARSAPDPIALASRRRPSASSQTAIGVS